jgi:huntingtin-interacting protein 1-related protein
MFPNLAPCVSFQLIAPSSFLINFQEPPNLLDSGDVPDLPARPAQASAPPAAPTPDTKAIDEQARMLEEYEKQQAALKAARDAEERRRLEMEQQQQREFEERQRQQAENQRLAQEQLLLQQQQMYQNQAAQQVAELERELLALRGQYERDQIFLEQYDRVSDTNVSNHSSNLIRHLSE